MFWIWLITFLLIITIFTIDLTFLAKDDIKAVNDETKELLQLSNGNYYKDTGEKYLINDGHIKYIDKKNSTIQYNNIDHPYITYSDCRKYKKYCKDNEKFCIITLSNKSTNIKNYK